MWKPYSDILFSYSFQCFLVCKCPEAFERHIWRYEAWKSIGSTPTALHVNWSSAYWWSSEWESMVWTCCTCHSYSFILHNCSHNCVFYMGKVNFILIFHWHNTYEVIVWIWISSLSWYTFNQSVLHEKNCSEEQKNKNKKKKIKKNK